MNFMMRTANAKGVYDPSKNRGRGAWIDDGRRVFHHGQFLTVDGVKVDCTRISRATSTSYARSLTRRPTPL